MSRWVNSEDGIYMRCFFSSLFPSPLFLSFSPQDVSSVICMLVYKDMPRSAREEIRRVRDVSADGTHECIQHVLVSREELRVNPHSLLIFYH